MKWGLNICVLDGCLSFEILLINIVSLRMSHISVWINW